MKSVARRSFETNLLLMRTFGLYPPEKWRSFYKALAYVMYVFFTLPVPVLGSLYFLLTEDLNMEEQTRDNAFIIAEMACQVPKLLPFIRHGHRIKRCIHYFDSAKFKVKSADQMNIIDEGVSTCRRNTRVFLISVLSGNIFWSTRPFFGTKRRLPADVWLPFELVSDGAFYSTYIFLVIGVAYASISCAALDPLIGGLACLAASQLKVLKDNLQHLLEYANQECNHLKTPVNRNDIIVKLIRKCIRHHQQILDFVSEYQDCFSVAVFSQFVGSILVICFCCLQLSEVEPMSYYFISMLSFLSTFLAQIFIYCYYGTILVDESNSLTSAVYMGQWYEYNVECRKHLIILMENSKQPLTVTAGKVLKITVDTFTMILRRSYSLLAVLKNR